jgi:hypothetical protein
MTFLNPWLLAGAAAIAAPILIHLLMRQRPRRMKWAAMRFLEAVVQRNERRLRVEDWLLLALRCLLLVLLAVALARPAFRAAGMGIGASGARTVVVAIDNSRAMGMTDGGASRLDNARRAADEIVGALPAGSAVAVVAYSDVARPVIGEPAADLNLVRKMIGQIALTDRAANARPALLVGLDILKRHAAGGGDIYLITDAQAAGWKELAAMRSEVGKSEARVTILIPGPSEQPHVGVSDLGLGSALVQAGAASRYTIEVTNYGTEPARDVPVSLSVDGEAPSDQAVVDAIPAGESRRVSLYGRVDGAGCHTITARVPADHFPADDWRTVVVRAIDEVRVLLVVGNAGATARDGDGFFLERALAPVAAEERAKYLIQTRTVGVEELPSVRLADYDAVALVDVPRLDQGAVTGLESFVRVGGGLMIFPGELTDPAFYNTMLGEGLGMLPAMIGQPWGDATQDKEFKTLQAVGYANPIVSIWNDPAAGTLATARFFKGVTLEPLRKLSDVAGDAATVLNYADGSAAMVERRWGLGRVIEFSSTANTGWNDLAAHPAFVPLMQRVLGRLVTTRDDGLNIWVGTEFTYPARTEWLYREMTVTPPGGAAVTSNVGLVAGEPLLRYEDTDMAGAYGIAIASEPPEGLRFAVQADAEKLEAAPDGELKTLGAGTQVIHWTPETNMREALAMTGAGREFWVLFAALALGVACCETYVAGRFSAPK